MLDAQRAIRSYFRSKFGTIAQRDPPGMYRYLVLFAAMLGLLGAASAEASCVYPEPPQALPDGTTADYDQMREAHSLVRAFDEDVRTFIVCLELEVKTLLEDPTIDDDTKAGLRELLTLRIDAAIEEVEFVVDQFNQQLRLFRERDAQ